MAKKEDKSEWMKAEKKRKRPKTRLKLSNITVKSEFAFTACLLPFTVCLSTQINKNRIF